MVYILIAILIFGVLIAVHEFGHFLAAKACGVRVNEFSIGMGPQLFHKTKGDTEYSLRLLPIGGYCAMEGEDEDSDDDRALGRQVWWKKFIIFVAGAFMNFLTGLIIVICLYAGAQAFYTTEIVELNPDFPQQGEDGLMPGDTIYAINGERIYLKSDVSLIMGLGDTGTIDMTVLRDGKKFDRTLTKQVYTDENGKDVTQFYKINADYGVLEVTPRSIVVSAGNAEKAYDGAPLTNRSYDIQSEYDTALAHGHRAAVTVTGSQTNVGRCDNVVSFIVIFDENGNDVTGNYSIGFRTGTLIVHPA